MKTEEMLQINTVIAADRAYHPRIEQLLDDSRQTRALRLSLLAIVLLVLVFLVWAALSEVDELARARGDVLPGQGVQTLQSEEGGSIVRFLVSEGDSVTAGQPLVEFAATNLKKEKEQNSIKLAKAQIDIERMAAVLEGRAPDFSAYADFPRLNFSLYADFPRLVEQAQTSYMQQKAELEGLLQAKRSAIVQQEVLIKGLQQDRRLLANELGEASRRLGILEEGARKGLVSKLMLSDARQQVTAVRERQSELEQRISSAGDQINILNGELANAESSFKQAVSIEKGKVTELWRELQVEQKALEQRADRFDIKAPVSGVVMSLPQTRENVVIAPGGVVAEIVPEGDTVVMEVMVGARDIGFIRNGQKAMVKIDAFDYSRFGSVEGRVERVSPTSVKNKETGQSFYKVRVSLETPFVGAQSRLIVAGMTGEADIVTGHKSVIQYLLKPIFLTADTAFHER